MNGNKRDIWWNGLADIFVQICLKFEKWHKRISDGHTTSEILESISQPKFEQDYHVIITELANIDFKKITETLLHLHNNKYKWRGVDIWELQEKIGSEQIEQLKKCASKIARYINNCADFYVQYVNDEEHREKLPLLVMSKKYFLCTVVEEGMGLSCDAMCYLQSEGAEK